MQGCGTSARSREKILIDWTLFPYYFLLIK